MTANQINYAKLQEERRTNLAKEDLTRQANYETMRSNLAKEGISHAANEESVRHNQRMETLERERNTLNYNASIFGSQVNQRNAELSYQSNIYSADSSRAASEYSSSLNYQGTVATVEQRDRARLTDQFIAADDRSATMATQRRGQNMNLIGTAINTVGNIASTVIGNLLKPVRVGR